MMQTHQLTKAEKEAFWRKYIAAHETSGESQSAYCRKEKISYGSFRLWKKKLTALEADTRQLVEMPIAIQTIQRENQSLEIILSSPPRIQVPESYSPEALIGLLKILGVSL